MRNRLRSLLLLGATLLAATVATIPVAAGEDVAEAGPYALQLTSPGPTGTATHNQLLGAQASTVAIDDDRMRVRADKVAFAGIAKGMRSVAIVVGGVWTLAVPDADQRFKAIVDLSKADNGPLVVDVFAWDAPPDDHSFKTNLSLRVHLFVEGGADGSPSVERPLGHPAHRRTLVWSENFDALSPKIWHAGPKPDGQEYSAAAFLSYSSTEPSPYTIRDGFLRIRANYQPQRTDPAGFGRKWTTGHLSTGFPDGSTSAAFRKGYAEVRMLLPAGPGCWPSFWLLDQDSIRNSAKTGAVEIDVIEAYGHATTSYVATEHDWPPPPVTARHPIAQRNITGLPDYSLGFHDYGVETTDDEVIFYFDGAEKFRAPLYRAVSQSPFFMMLTLAISQDWPVAVPPSGYYDLWIDQVRVYR
ncbi:glycoside hydrolase family 16 protein [Methylobacterium sp. C25]|uniref:glycoside hydrolase family 16 protein n=1 Tax=Methylobacterium sp. C25 TaxID=2721622 RepID=UPI001F38D964|nr:glycoside hydrolase family 16 protein [Methylobacterium sp. C25]MCE4225124.1 glycoside hydrolase family 16 protein [Methylobacterium sp. C25]